MKKHGALFHRCNALLDSASSGARSMNWRENRRIASGNNAFCAWRREYTVTAGDAHGGSIMKSVRINNARSRRARDNALAWNLGGSARSAASNNHRKTSSNSSTRQHRSLGS